MKVVSYQEKGFAVIKVDGRLDIATAPQFEQDCKQVIEAGQHNVILDFSGLEYISSAGLRGILTTARKIKLAGGSFAVTGLTGVVKEVFDLSGFDTFVTIYGSLEEALGAGGQ